MLHITNGDAVVPDIAKALGIASSSILVWRDVLHDGPVPAELEPDALAQVRAKHLASRGWVDEAVALTDLRSRDSQLTRVPVDEEIVLWFEEDLFDVLQLAQISDRLSGRIGPVSRVYLRHPPRGDLQTAFHERVSFAPDGVLFAAIRSSDPRAWIMHPKLHRLLEELPDSHTGLSRLERLILEVLEEKGAMDRQRLYREVSLREHAIHPPWIADLPLWALAEELRPLVSDRYEITTLGREVLAGRQFRSRPKRWIGGVNLDGSRWQWDAREWNVTLREDTN